MKTKIKWQKYFADSGKTTSMQQFGEHFIDALPKHIENLKIPGRLISSEFRRLPHFAQIDQIPEIQNMMHEVLCHPITQNAQICAERAFTAFLDKEKPDSGVLKFFNGWNETHKTTSLVSAKIIMRLSADALSIPADSLTKYNITMAHMYEVAKDDFGLGHAGHDGMYTFMTNAFDASDWVESQYIVEECNAFSGFLYKTGVAEHKAALNSVEHRKSIMDAMMVSIASELWNGREYNFRAQHIEGKLLSANPALASNANDWRTARGYVMGHSGEVENKHGLHALAAAQEFARLSDRTFNITQLKETMIDYNQRIGRAFSSLSEILKS